MKDPLIVALDFPTEIQALKMVENLLPFVKNFKVGLELFVSAGPQIVSKIKNMGGEVFIDLKLFDIPNTVGRTIEKLLELEPIMITLHILGGEDMLRKAVEVTENYRIKNKKETPYLLGVTVLTSFSEEGFRRSWGVSRSLPEQVFFLAQLAQETGLDGVIASPQEIELLRRGLKKRLLIVTPGIRLTKDVKDDQKRIMTPKEALEKGSDYLVIGRPITAHPNPSSVVQEIRSQISDILESRI